MLALSPASAIAQESDTVVGTFSGEEITIGDLDIVIRELGDQLGQGPQGLGQGEEMGREDPFGRAPNEATPGQADGDVAIPDVGDLQRAREIRDELRRRSGDQSRPDKELDYIDRLLKQFN